MKVRLSKVTLATVLSIVLLTGACNAATVQAYISLAVQIALQIAQLAGAPPAAAGKVLADLTMAQRLYADFAKADTAAKPDASEPPKPEAAEKTDGKQPVPKN